MTVWWEIARDVDVPRIAERVERCMQSGGGSFCQKELRTLALLLLRTRAPDTSVCWFYQHELATLDALYERVTKGSQ